MGQRDEARWWESGEASPMPGYPGPERCGKRESATSRSILLHPPILQHGALGPTEGGREGGDPNTFEGGLFCAELGKMEFSHLVRALDILVLFSAPVQDKERRDLKKKNSELTIGKKANHSF